MSLGLPLDDVRNPIRDGWRSSLETHHDPLPHSASEGSRLTVTLWEAHHGLHYGELSANHAGPIASRGKPRQTVRPPYLAVAVEPQKCLFSQWAHGRQWGSL